MQHNNPRFSNSLSISRGKTCHVSPEAYQDKPSLERTGDENKAIEEGKKNGKKYEPVELQKSDSPKQLSARCRYILAKKTTDWTEGLHERASLLFTRYHTLKTAYEHTMEFWSIHEHKNIDSSFSDCINYLLSPQKINVIQKKEFAL